MVYHPFRHLGLKVLSVAVAAALWFAVAGEQTVERSLRVPLELKNRPESLELVDNPPAQVDVRVRGPAALLSEIGQGDVIAVLDLGGARPGRRLLHINLTHIRVPLGVEATQVSPTTVSMLFERSASKRVPVAPVVDGEPAAGFVAGQATAEPREVEVVGPESAVQRVKEAITEPVSITGATSRVRETVGVGVADSSVRLRTSLNATVTVPIVTPPAERLVPRVPVLFRNLGPRLTAQVFPPVAGLATRGPKDVLDALGAGAIVAYVELAGLGPGQYNLPVRVEPPQDVEVRQIDPATVRVRIR